RAHPEVGAGSITREVLAVQKELERLRPKGKRGAGAPPPGSRLGADHGLLDPAPQLDDRGADLTLRPRTLDEYVGQEKMKANLRVFIKAALGRNEPIDHVLLYGPPGLGKTTVA